MATTTSTYAPSYAPSANISISPENVASSSTFTVGGTSNAISNLETKYADVLVSGVWTCGTTPTATTQLQVWVYAPLTDNGSSVTWPDTIDGNSGTKTITSQGILAGALRLGATLYIDSTTSNRPYPCAPFSVASLFGNRMPTRWGLYLSHNSGVTSNTIAASHSWSYIGIKDVANTVDVV